MTLNCSFTWCGRSLDQVFKVICSEDCDSDLMRQSLILKRNEDLRRTAKPLTHLFILGDQTLQSKGKSSRAEQRGNVACGVCFVRYNHINDLRIKTL